MDSEVNKVLYEVEDTKEFQMLGQGNTAEIYQYEEHKILKLFREGMPLPPIENEYRISSLVQSEVHNVPRVYEIVKYRDRIGIVYEQIVGKGMIQLFLGHFFQLKQYAKQFASIHLSVHENDIDVHTSLKDKLRWDIDSTSDLTSSEKEKIKQYLNTLPDKNKLCHFDFHPGNIIYRGNDPVVIDWMTGCTGDPNADVARTLLLMRMGEMMHINPFVKTALHFFTKRVGKMYWKEYQRISGVSTNEVEKWILPVAAARLSEWLTDHERKKLVSLVKKELASLAD